MQILSRGSLKVHNAQWSDKTIFQKGDKFLGWGKSVVGMAIKKVLCSEREKILFLS